MAMMTVMSGGKSVWWHRGKGVPDALHDLTIKVGERETTFFAHRYPFCVPPCHSDLFLSKLLDGDQHPSPRVLVFSDIPEIAVGVFERFLDFVYDKSGHINITKQVAVPLLMLADYFLVPELQGKINLFIQTASVKDLMVMWKQANTVKSETFQSLAFTCFHRLRLNFHDEFSVAASEAAERQRFAAAVPVELLIQLLEDELLCVPDEDARCDIILAMWSVLGKSKKRTEPNAGGQPHAVSGNVSPPVAPGEITALQQRALNALRPWHLKEKRLLELGHPNSPLPQHYVAKACYERLQLLTAPNGSFLKERKESEFRRCVTLSDTLSARVAGLSEGEAIVVDEEEDEQGVAHPASRPLFQADNGDGDVDGPGEGEGENGGVGDEQDDSQHSAHDSAGPHRGGQQRGFEFAGSRFVVFVARKNSKLVVGVRRCLNNRLSNFPNTSPYQGCELRVVLYKSDGPNPSALPDIIEFRDSHQPLQRQGSVGAANPVSSVPPSPQRDSQPGCVPTTPGKGDKASSASASASRSARSREDEAMEDDRQQQQQQQRGCTPTPHSQGTLSTPLQNSAATPSQKFVQTFRGPRWNGRPLAFFEKSNGHGQRTLELDTVLWPHLDVYVKPQLRIGLYMRHFANA